MATAYGGYYTGAGYNAFRARMDYSTSATTDTSATIQVIVKCQMGSGHDSGSNFRGVANINGSTSTYTGSGYYSASGTYTMGTKTLSITKTHSAQSITVKATVTSTYAWSGHSSTASATVSVPALTSYAVTYDANTGSGAPGSQTKWYGEALTLSAATPTLAGYDFVGWSTTQSTPGSGTATYTAGGSYTANAAATLYAVWKRAYIAPKISSLSVYRASDTSGTASDEGTYCYVKCSWSVDTTLTSGNKGQTLAIEYKTASATSWTSAKSVSLSAASGTTQTAALDTASFDTSTAYNIRVTVSDTSGQTGNTASATSTLSPAFYTFDLRSGGHGIGMGHAADVEDCVHLGMKLRMANVDMQVIDTDLPAQTATPDATVQGNGIVIYGSDTQRVGALRGDHFASGSRGLDLIAQRTVNGTTISNYLRLFIGTNGSKSVAVSDQAIWRTALGETAWTNLSLDSAVVAYDTDSTPKYRRIMGSLVTITGAVKPAAQVSAGDTLSIGTLPTGFRPPRYVCCLCQGSGGAQWLLGVNADGTVDCSRYRNGSTNAAIPTTAWLTFHFVFAL
jgi:hypothetical protein